MVSLRNLFRNLTNHFLPLYFIAVSTYLKKWICKYIFKTFKEGILNTSKIGYFEYYFNNILKIDEDFYFRIIFKKLIRTFLFNFLNILILLYLT